MERLLSLSSSAREMVDLPAPDGDDSTSIRPRRAIIGSVMTCPVPLLDILDLLAELINRRFEAEADPGQAGVRRFRAQSVDLAIELLGQEIKLAPARVALG